MSPMARSFYGDNKRISNAAIKQAGYRFAYPIYHVALQRMWDEGGWAADHLVVHHVRSDLSGWRAAKSTLSLQVPGYRPRGRVTACDAT